MADEKVHGQRQQFKKKIIFEHPNKRLALLILSGL
jgi:hypothetical protein